MKKKDLLKINTNGKYITYWDQYILFELYTLRTNRFWFQVNYFDGAFGL